MKNPRSVLIVVLTISAAPTWAGPSGTGEDGEKLAPTVMRDAQLDQLRGRQTVFNRNDINGQLHDNEAVSNVTGNNYVTDGSFSGMSGFSTVIQNSGNNVLIQNATILNLQFQ